MGQLTLQFLNDAGVIDLSDKSCNRLRQAVEYSLSFVLTKGSRTGLRGSTAAERLEILARVNLSQGKRNEERKVKGTRCHCPYRRQKEVIQKRLVGSEDHDA